MEPRHVQLICNLAEKASRVIDRRISTVLTLLAFSPPRKERRRMNQNTLYTITNHIQYEIQGDDGLRVLIIPEENGIPNMKHVLCLSDTSLFIWRQLADNRSTAYIIEQLCREYSKNRDEITNDVEVFIKELTDNHYITPTE